MLSPDEIKALEEKYGSIDDGKLAHVVGAGGKWEAVFRKPTRMHYKRFRAQLFNDSTKADAMENLARACAVYPEGLAFDALLEEYPGACEAAAKKLTDMMGVNAEEESK